MVVGWMDPNDSLPQDQVIHNQSIELDQLRQANRKLLMAARQDVTASDEECPPSPSSANPASKMPKLDHCEDKENVVQLGGETPLVTKMVRRFELPPPPAAGQKPEVPKKPTRLLNSQPQLQPATSPTPINASPSSTDTANKGVVRTDSVNDHGYFTLEKRKPVRMSVASPTPDQTPTSPAPLDPPPQKDLVTDETDLRQNFEEFHLMDSLEEEEQQQLQFQVCSMKDESFCFSWGFSCCIVKEVADRHENIQALIWGVYQKVWHNQKGSYRR